jgi:DNA-binding MarR family transcriptional regulator
MQASVIPVIALWEEFLSKNDKAGVKEFARWILQKENDNKGGDAASPFFKAIRTDKLTEETGFDDSAKAMLLISRLHRLLQMKSKPIIKKLGFTKDHEYNMITHIYLLKNPNKKELAEQMLLHNSTAVEITNRLIKKGIVMEVEDERDKRSTRIGLTPVGEQMLIDSYAHMQQLPLTFMNCLNTGEKKELVSLLQKVEEYQGQQ